MLSGVVATIKWHHYTAAGIHGYTVSPTTKARTVWTLSANVVLADAFKMSQQPLEFVVKHPKGEWRWPITRLTRVEHRLTATLGPPHTNTHPAVASPMPVLVTSAPRS